MHPELKSLKNEFEEIRKKFGIKAYNKIADFCDKMFFTYYRKIEDLIKSRDRWKEKYFKLKNRKV